MNEPEGGTIFYVKSLSGGKSRLIRAVSKVAVERYLAKESWTEPRPAKVGDMEKAMGEGVKVESALG